MNFPNVEVLHISRYATIRTKTQRNAHDVLGLPAIFAKFTSALYCYYFRLALFYS